MRESNEFVSSPGTEVRLDASGNVRFSESLSLAPGVAPLVLDGIELKSPVVANDQYVVLDRRIADSGVDVDRDGKQDVLDVGVWRSVVGEEKVSLPNTNQPRDAVRVDTTAVVRTTPSGGGAPTSVTARLSTWYADGIGIIRETEMGTDGRTLDADEVLLGYDGIDSGYGWIPVPREATWTEAYGGSSQVFKLPDGVLLAGAEFKQLDKRGRLVNTYPFAPAGGTSFSYQFARLRSASFVIVQRSPTGNSGQSSYALHALSNAGQPTEAAAAVLNPFDQDQAPQSSRGPLFFADESADLLWVVWERLSSQGSSGSQTELVIRRHDGQRWIGNATVVSADPDTYSFNASARGGSLMLTWITTATSSITSQHLAQIDGSGQVRATNSFQTPQRPGTLSGINMSLLGDSESLWAFWNMDPSWNSSSQVPYAVRVDPNGDVVGGSDIATLRSALLPGLADIRPDGQFQAQLSVSGGQWFYADRSYGKAYPDDTKGDRFSVDYRVIDPGAGAPAAGMKTIARYRLPDRQVRGLPIVFDTHVLLLTGGLDGLTSATRPTIVWRN